MKVYPGVFTGLLPDYSSVFADSVFTAFFGGLVFADFAFWRFDP